MLLNADVLIRLAALAPFFLSPPIILYDAFFNKKTKTTDAYSTMQGTIEYEVENKITVIKKKPYSGTRAINRLTRALIFIVKLLEDLIVAPDDASAGKVASEAYAATLKKHHPWLVQKTVGAAMYTLPNRDKLIVKLCGEAKNQDDLDAVGKTGAILTKLNNANTEFLGKHDLLDIK